MPPPNDLGGYFAGTGESFYTILTQAVADITEYGFDSADRIAMWVMRLRNAAHRSMTPLPTLERTLNDTLTGLYRSNVERGGMLRLHPGVAQFTLDRVKPKLRRELDRRIMACASLIKLDRDASIEKTIQRLSGWATSIPPGGSDAVDRNEVKLAIRKPLASLPFTERRVIVDQSHKFVANLNNILAVDAGALAARWNSHAGQANYNFRKEHAERAGKVYLLRDNNWALEKGFIKVGPAGYLDEITAPGEEVFCRCWVTYIYHLRSMPSDMVTEKGRQEMARVRIAA